MNWKFSAVIIAKNEARTIEKCILALLKVTNDVIVVLDESSDDETGEIANDLGAKVFVKKWEGYSANKNFGAQTASNDWIISMDADEVMNDELVKAIENLTPNINTIYSFNRKTYFGGQAVTHSGWFPDWIARIYNKNTVRWNDNEVHEKLIADHPISMTKIKDGLVCHYSFANEMEMQNKFDKYARLRANEWYKSGKKPPILKQLFGPYFRFFKTYIIRKGFLDGNVGFTIAKNEFILKRKELIYYENMVNDIP